MSNKRKTWRCFHCDDVFRSRRQARLHFGTAEYEDRHVPACVDPLRTDEKARMAEVRECERYALECQESERREEDRADEAESRLREYERITGCGTLHELRMWMDSQQGRVVTAEVLINAVRDKAPEIYAEVIQ